jgi:hypothetical protein
MHYKIYGKKPHGEFSSVCFKFVIGQYEISLAADANPIPPNGDLRRTYLRVFKGHLDVTHQFLEEHQTENVQMPVLLRVIAYVEDRAKEEA